MTKDSSVAICGHFIHLLLSLYAVFSDWGFASKVAACRGRPRAVESRSDAWAGGTGTPGESGQGATGTAVAQKPQQERHRPTPPTRQRLQQLILSLSLDSAPIHINTALIDSTNRPIMSTSMRVSPAHMPLSQRKTGGFLNVFWGNLDTF